MQPNPRLNQHFCPGSQDSATPWEENQQHTDKLKSQKRKIIWFNFKLFFSPCCPVQQCSESVSEMKIALLETFFYFFFLLFWGVAVQTSLESLCWQHNGIHRYPTPNPPDFPHVPIPHSSPCSPGATGKKEHLTQMLTKESFFWGVSDSEKSRELVIASLWGSLQEQTCGTSTSGSRRSWGCCSPLQWSGSPGFSGCLFLHVEMINGSDCLGLCEMPSALNFSHRRSFPATGSPVLLELPGPHLPLTPLFSAHFAHFLH